MQISGWGKYPTVDSEQIIPRSLSDLKTYFGTNTSFSGIARGMGRSYGDSALATQTISTQHLNHILEFNNSSGVVNCTAGVTLADLLDVFVPRGWFLPVTPGTKYVSIGGAIASDVHGKNHHVAGCFSEHIESFRILLANGDIVTCSTKENVELFHATCGGMGLTGIIIDAKIKLKHLQSSNIHETTLKAQNLAEILELIDQHDSVTYSVAWIDCLATGSQLGRSLLMLGEHTEDGGLEVPDKTKISIPIDMPNFLLNSFSVNIFNTIYYNRKFGPDSKRTLSYESFFYPLDSIRDWNKMYGKQGFTQYQFVIPKEAGLEGMQKILQLISESKQGSFLSVLKSFGDGNQNYLSFPKQGYTLALDFKMNSGTLSLLNRLDEIVLDYGGRIYLTKDARMSEKTFKTGYPKWEEFEKVRSKYGAKHVFQSLQSNRLGI